MAVKSLISFILSGLLFLPAFYTSSAAAKATTTKGELTVQDCDPLNENQRGIRDCFKLRVQMFCEGSTDREACRGEQRLKHSMTDSEYASLIEDPQGYFNKWWPELGLKVQLPVNGGRARKVAALLGYKSLNMRGDKEFLRGTVARCGVTFKETVNRLTCANYAGITCANDRYTYDTCTLAEEDDLTEYGNEYEFSNDSSRVLL